ncbi:MAG: hypothetical protein K2G50_00665 [Anaeroplasmataceae bacterium]|nr:hypothetical protein [Anaeroplasmataceae bacterium]
MILILYFGHTGTTKKAADLLAKHFNDVEVLEGAKQLKLDYNKYNQIIVGSNIRAGKLNKAFLKWYKKEGKHLKMPISAYIVGADASQRGSYIASMEKVLKQYAIIRFVGGELDPTRAKGIFKKIIENCLIALENKNLEAPKLLMEEIDLLAEEVQNKKVELNQPSGAH